MRGVDDTTTGPHTFGRAMFLLPSVRTPVPLMAPTLTEAAPLTLSLHQRELGGGQGEDVLVVEESSDSDVEGEQIGLVELLTGEILKNMEVLSFLL